MKQIFLIAGLAVCAGCNGLKSIKNVLTKPPPYEQYVKSLESARLEGTALASKWISAGKEVFNDSIIISMPFQESGFFESSEPAARSFRFDVKDGQKLSVTTEVQAENAGRVFLDLFVYEDGEWDQVAHADSTLDLTHEFSDDRQCVLRLQPELLSDVFYNVRLILSPALINPVAGASNRSIGSFFGDPRDNGNRSHEGVDIFASRGTPIVAPAAGYISRTGNNRLGGKVVWLKDDERDQSYYFAHLDSQLVHSGTRVMAGDTIGLVGNSGNARYTPPHLHFGIYQHGSKDPVHYIKTLKASLDTFAVDTLLINKHFKTISLTSNLRTGPDTSNPVIRQLIQNTFVRIIGQSGNWLRTLLPDGSQGYLHKSLIATLEMGKPEKLPDGATLLSKAAIDSVPIAHLPEEVSVFVLAEFENFSYVKTIDGRMGWLVI